MENVENRMTRQREKEEGSCQHLQTSSMGVKREEESLRSYLYSNSLR
jgi:hypothetical protein